MDDSLLRILFRAGQPLSPLYGLAMRGRAALYRQGILAVTRLPLPVVSVGNLSLGGTGKTPLVLHLARLLQAAGLRPAVLSRGYGGQSGQEVNLVSDGADILLSPAQAGDEPVMLARALPGVPVVTARRRAAGGRLITARGLAGSIILDDGFQHLALARDLDLVLFSAQGETLTERVFPGGRLREPWSAIARAHALVITGASEPTGTLAASIKGKLQEFNPTAPVFTARYQALGIYGRDGLQAPVAKLAGVPLLACCGIANPASFRSLLNDNLSILGERRFADHHPFSQADLTALAAQAQALGCQGIITTEKDFVKLRDLKPPAGMPVWALSARLLVEEGLERLVLARLKGSTLRTPGWLCPFSHSD